MSTEKINKNSTICGHCKQARSVNGSWQCGNPQSSSYGRPVSYANHACELYEPLGDRSKKPRIPRDLYYNVKAFLDAEWVEPVASEDAAFAAPDEPQAFASESYSFDDGAFGAFKTDLESIEYADMLPDIEPEKGETQGDAFRSSRKASAQTLHKRDTYTGSLDSSLTQKDIADIFGGLGQTFQEKLLAEIDKRGLRDSEVYGKANIDRRLFSKIRSNKDYKPSKPTALALAIALGLNLDETTDLLQRAGLALSQSSKADLIVKYCILNGIYDIYDVNAILYEYDQPLLGY